MPLLRERGLLPGLLPGHVPVAGDPTAEPARAAG
jgi:hypothetical protein